MRNMNNDGIAKWAFILCVSGLLFVIMTAIALDGRAQAIEKARRTHIFHYKPDQFIMLTLKDGDMVYINMQSIESMSPHRDSPGDTEVRTLTQEYHVKEDIQTIKDYITEQ